MKIRAPYCKQFKCEMWKLCSLLALFISSHCGFSFLSIFFHFFSCLFHFFFSQCDSSNARTKRVHQAKKLRKREFLRHEMKKCNESWRETTTEKKIKRKIIMNIMLLWKKKQIEKLKLIVLFSWIFYTLFRHLFDLKWNSFTARTE